MKKTLIVLILIMAFSIGAYSQSTSELSDLSGPSDLLVLLDTSASMSSFHKETIDYLIGPFLKEFLRIGDTFHLISFSTSPRLEISRRIEGIGDVEAIIGRMLLMYPLDPQSDLAGALSFAENFSSSLSGGRSKKLVLLTDGDAPNTESLVNDAAARLRNQRTDLQYIRVPVSGTGPSSGRPAQTANQVSATNSAATQAATTTQPPAASQTPATTQAPVTQATQPTGQTQAASQTQPGQTTQTTPPQAASSPSQQTTQPATQAAASETRPAVPPTGSTAQTSTQQSASNSQAGTGFFQGGIPMPLLIGLAILALIILGLIIFFAVRNLHSSPNRVMAQAAAPQDTKTAELMSSYAETQAKQARPPLEYPPSQKKPLPKDKYYDESLLAESNGGPLMLNLFVADQNTAIGRRNIHSAKSGATFSIGGGKSDFLIFLVPFPPHIADLQYDGRNCTFIPRTPKYFPDIGSEIVPNCIGKSIRVVSDKNYELHIRIERYEDPLKALNRLLNSISVPGPAR